MEEVHEFKKYSGKPADVYSTEGLREKSVQENVWISDSHDCTERDTIQEGSASETSLRQFSHPKMGLNAFQF